MDTLSYAQISEAIHGNGWENWTLIVFNDDGNYNIFSVMNDECSMGVLKTVLDDMQSKLKEDDDNTPLC